MTKVPNTKLVLKTERTVLRGLTYDDIPHLQRIAGVPHIARMLCSVKSPWPKEDVADWIDQSIFNNQVGFRLGITTHEGELIGSVGLGGDYPSISYFLEEAYWGQGLIVEAASAIIEFGFDHLGLSEITSDVFVDNPASAKVLEKLGFEECGRSTACSAARLDEAPIILYRLTKHNNERKKNEIS